MNRVEDPDISNESFDSKVKKTINQLIFHPVKIFDKPNKSVHFEVKKIPINRLAICHLT